jgi:hypothetical protein
LESSWKWNAWAGSGQNMQAELAAHLLAPIAGRDWLVRTDTDPLRYLIACTCLDTGFGFTDHLILADANELGFPYGYDVDQTRLVLT